MPYRGSAPGIQDLLGGQVPPDMVHRAADAIKAAVTSPDVVEALARLGLEAMASTPAELAQRVREENAQWGPIVKRVGLTPEN